jgi:hypothetical protein
MNGARIVKKLLEGKPGGGRKNGRPRLRRTDDVESDLRNMGVKKMEIKNFGENRMGIYPEGS